MINIIAHICGLIILIGILTTAISIWVMHKNPKRPKILLAGFIIVSIMMVVTIIAFAVGLMTAPHPAI